MPAEDTELNEPNAASVATVKLELPGDHQKKQGLRRIFQEYPRGGRALAVLLLAAVIIGGALFVSNSLAWESTDDAQVNGHIMPLSARINGYVLEVPVIEGQLVHAGDVLVTIDPKDYRIAVQQAQATFADSRASAASSRFNVPITSVTSKSNLDSAGTAVVNAEAGFQAAQQNFESAKAVLQQAEANAAKSDADLVRYEQLVAKEDISHQQYDQSVAAAKANRSGVVSAGASVLAAEQAVHQAKGKLSQSRADLRSAETAPQQVSMTRAKADAADAQARERRAQLDQAELNLSYTVVRSPVTGIIGKKTVEVGQNVGIGQELVEVVPLDDVWVTANFKETQLAHMRPGQPVEIKVDAYGRSWKAHVTNMGAGAGSVFSLLPPENATGNYVKVVQRVPVRIDFDRPSDRASDRNSDRNPGSDFNVEGLLKPGLSVEPEVRVR
jgi:membrane fusion protein (multidrug efflux system)